MNTITSRIESHIVLGAEVYWVPDGTPYGENNGQTTNRNNKPAWADVVGQGEEPGSGLGKFLGTVQQWRFNTTYTELEKKGCSVFSHRHESKKYRNILNVAPTFSTQDVVPEAFALLFGLDQIPEAGQSAQPFSNASCSLPGWLYVRVLDSFRATGDADDELAQIILHGDLRLTDTGELTSDLVSVSFELVVDRYPKDGFTNTAINASLPNI